MGQPQPPQGQGQGQGQAEARPGQARPSPHGWGQAQTRPMAGQGGVRQGPWCSLRLAKMGPWDVAWLGSTLTKL